MKSLLDFTGGPVVKNARGNEDPAQPKINKMNENLQNKQTKNPPQKQNLWFKKQEKKKKEIKHESMEESPFLSTDVF